jgi:hypothetical protein
MAGLLGISAMAQTAPAGQTLQNTQLEWNSQSLDLTFKYPADLVRRDPVEAMKDEHLMLYGIPGGQVQELAAATHCLRPLLSLELPTSGGTVDKIEEKQPDGSTKVTLKPALLGTILLAELDIDCMTPEQQVMAHDLQTGMLTLLAKVPGMHAMMQPSMYLVGKQKMHMAAAQGLPKVETDSGSSVDPLFSYTMGFTTSWNNHLLVWYLSSNSFLTLNRMTKSVVRFGNQKPDVLYPMTVGYQKR